MIELADKAKPVLLSLKLAYLRKLDIRLFQNDKRPTGNDSAVDFTEATFPGYSSQKLSDLGNAFLNPSGQGQSNTCTHTWRMTLDAPSNLIYGYYCTDLNGYLIFSDRNPLAPVAMDRAGATYTLVINFIEDTLR